MPLTHVVGPLLLISKPNSGKPVCISITLQTYKVNAVENLHIKEKSNIALGVGLRSRCSLLVNLKLMQMHDPPGPINVLMS